MAHRNSNERVLTDFGRKVLVSATNKSYPAEFSVA